MSHLYVFVNPYLSDKQIGIQSLHVLGEIVLKYFMVEGNLHAESREQLKDWLKLGKTVRVLRGGGHEWLRDLYLTFCQMSKERMDYPFEAFTEEQLHRSYTAVGIILPELFADKEDRERIIADTTTFTLEERYLAQLLLDCQSA